MRREGNIQSFNPILLILIKDNICGFNDIPKLLRNYFYLHIAFTKLVLGVVPTHIHRP